MRPNFELVTDFQSIIRRDFVTQQDLDPSVANALLDGEWMTLDNNYELVRGNVAANAADLTLAAGAVAAPAYPVFTEGGRYDTRAIGKITVLFSAGWEADTAIFGTSTASRVAAVGDPLFVTRLTALGTDVTQAGVKRGLSSMIDAGGLIDNTWEDFTPGGAPGAFVQAYCTRIAANNGGRLRFVSVAP